MRHIGYDTETKGLDLRDDVRTLQLYESKGTILEDPDDWELAREDLEDESVEKIIHSSEFDIPMTYFATKKHLKKPILIKNVWDTKLMEAIILGVGMQRNMDDVVMKKWTKELQEKYSTSLAETLRRRKIAKLDKTIRATYYDKKIEAAYIKKYGKEGLRDMQKKYELDDVKYLKILRDQQYEDLKRMGLLDLAKMENYCAEVTALMRIHGIGFSERIWMKIHKDNVKKYNEIIDQLPAHVKWSSHAQVKKYFAKKDIRINSISDITKFPHKWKGMHPHMDLYIEMKDYMTAISKYGENWLIQKGNGYPTVHPDGRVRCNFDQILNTGRFSSSKPNLQQLPGQGLHRNAFIPEDGWLFEIGDYTGQELGIMAVGANEQSWVNAMVKGHDVHSVMGAELYGTEWKFAEAKDCKFPFKCKCPEHMEMRRPVKDLNFGLAYGKGAESLGIDMNKTTEEAADLMRKYKKKIPAITKWLNKNGQYAVNFKETFTLPPFNRRRTLLEDEEWRRRNQGKNTPVQGTGGDILKLAMVNMLKYIRKHKLEKKVRIVLCVHDEIITEVRKEYATTWKPIMKKIMEDAALEVTKVVCDKPIIHVEPSTCKFWPYKDQDPKEYAVR